MGKTYSDVVKAMAEAHVDGYTVSEVVLTKDTIDTFLESDDFTDADEERQDTLGEFEVPLSSGDGNYVLTENGKRYEV